ncbi:2-hydroxychromene-2-carboxylate isomerase [mine drainage metagenome]|uniref:2-hydroxychromene-2-carboxylate isomerase n=1 Tax=mine drainage metagenome TaxID=410659 RepID=A0A1J5QAI5_9ZZZZ
MAHIDYFFSTMSPFTYLAGTRLEEIAARHGATLSYKPMDILALFTRTGGTAPKDRHDNRKAYRMQELKRQSVKAGLAMNFAPMFFPVNTAPSSYAIIAAQKAGGGDVSALVHGFTRAVWAEERNIAEDEVIRDVMTRAGLDPAIADRGMMMAADTYMANLEEAVSRGVFGAPFYICDDDERFWGQDRLDDLDLHLAGKL